MYNGDGLRTEKWGDRTTQYIILDGTYLGEKTTFYGGTTYLITYIYGAEGSVIGLDVNGTAYYFVKNLQGDVTSIIDVNGNILANYSYDAYGYCMSITDGNGNEVTSATHIANLNPFRYRGYMYDQETGFYYLTSRYYDPAVCRFLNADKYISTGTGFCGFNMYAYCNDNPVNMLDTEGSMVAAATTGALAGLSFYSTIATVGVSNIWNPIGIGIAVGAIVIGAAIIGYQIYDYSKSTSRPKTKTLADVTSQRPDDDEEVYNLAVINKDSNQLEIIDFYNMTYGEAIGVGVSSVAIVRLIRKKNKKTWGIYTEKQEHAKAVAEAVGCIACPEVHDSGYYGHYHDGNHTFHIWYGDPIFF